MSQVSSLKVATVYGVRWFSDLPESEPLVCPDDIRTIFKGWLQLYKSVSYYLQVSQKRASHNIAISTEEYYYN